MSQDEGSSIGTSLVVFLIGVAVGAAAAILYAPMAGSETRAKLAETAERLKERATEVGREVAEKTKELAAKVRPQQEETEPAGEAVAPEPSQAS